MFKKIVLIVFIFIAGNFLFANNTITSGTYTIPNDSIVFNKSLEQSRSAQKFSYLNTTQRLSNTIYLDKHVSAAQLSVKDSAIEMFSRITQNNTWLNSITNGATPDLPFGITRTIAPQTTVYQVGFTNITFTKEGAIARAFARVLPNGGGNGELYFEGRVNLSRIGGVGQDNTLKLIGNHNISFNANAFTLQINGGSETNSTTFHFNCDGFTKLTLHASIEINASSYFSVSNTTYERVSNGKILSNNFQTQLEQWEKIYIENVSFPGLIGNSKLPNYFFRINNATIDFSTLRNTDNNSFTNYFRSLNTAQQNIWMGFNISDMDILLPSIFTPVGSNTRSFIKADFGIIDENGLSFYAKSTNAISDIQSNFSSANGWPMGIHKFDLMYIKDAVVQQSSFFEGRIVLPIEDRNYSERGIPFKARFKATTDQGNINDFDVEAGSVDFILAKNFRGHLFPDTDGIDIDFTVKNNKIFPTVTLSGKFGFWGSRKDTYEVNEVSKKAKEDKAKEAGKETTSKELNIKDIEFQDMVLQTETAPYLKVNYAGGAASVEIGGFGAQVSVEFRNTGVTARNNPDPNAVTIRIDAAVQVADGKFGGAMGINLFCKYDQTTRTFEFEELRLGSLNIKADLGPSNSIDGSLDILDGPEYGQGFSGQVIMTVANKLTLKAGVMFGNKAKASGGRFQYFNVDGSADFRPAGVVIFGVIKITGFSGGFTYRMDPIQPSAKYPPTITGVSYVPNENSFLRLRAGIFFSLANDNVFSGWGGLEFVFNNNWGLNEVNISGKAQLFSQPFNEDKNKISPLMEARQQTYMTYKANQGEVVGEEASSIGEEVITEDGTRIKLNKKTSLNYLPGNFETNNTNNSLQKIILEDTISVRARMKTVQGQIDSAIADVNFIKNKIQATTLLKNREDSLKAAMNNRMGEISRKSSWTTEYFKFWDANRLLNYNYQFRVPEEWRAICSILNIPFLEPQKPMQVRRVNYSRPTQERINAVRDSLNNVNQVRVVAINNLINQYRNLQNSFQNKANDAFSVQTTTAKAIRENLNSVRDVYGFLHPETVESNKRTNDQIRASWALKRTAYLDSVKRYQFLQDSITNHRNTSNTTASVLSDNIKIGETWSKNVLISTVNSRQIRNENVVYTLLEQATITYNYYNDVLVHQFPIHDSIVRLEQTKIKPLEDSIFRLTEKFKEYVARQNALEKVYNDTLVVVNNYNLAALAAHRLRIRIQANQATPTREENEIIAREKETFTKAAPIINSWIVSNKRNQINSAQTNISNTSSAIAAQRAIINSSSATTAQKNAARNTLNNLLVQYRSDSATIANNILATNGGAIFTYPGKLEMFHISKYVPTTFRNTDIIYANIQRLENELKGINTTIRNLESRSNQSRDSEFFGLLREENIKKQKVEDELNIQVIRAVPVIAFNLLNNPAKASVDLFTYRNTGIRFLQISKSIDTAQAWVDRAILFIEDSIQNSVKNSTRFTLGGVSIDLPSSMVKQPRPEGNPKFWGDFVLKIDIKNSAVSLSMNVYASIDEKGIEVIKGSMDDSRKAGTLDLIFSKSTFQLYIGKEAAPCSVDIIFNRFMTGKGTFFLETNNQIVNTSGNVSNFRITFGLSGKIVRRAELDLGILKGYAYLEGGASLKATVARFNNFTCAGRMPGVEDFNGWYGEGKLTAYIKGAAGVVYFGEAIDIVTAQLKVGITLRGPSPIYFNGNVNFRYSVFGFSGSADIDIEYGDKCMDVIR
ncbi:MAG: hypothetical protein MH132_00860 [Hydrotalea sp.]|nr:hypothetical protein [Hydrotalea sp.]